MAIRAILPLVLLGALGATSQTRDPLDDLFARGRAMQATLHSVSASFTETTVSSLLRDPLVARGTVIAALPLRMLMTYSSPEVRYILLDQTRIVTVVPARHEREELNIADMQKRIQKYFVDASPKELRQSFDIALTADPSNRDGRPDGHEAAPQANPGGTLAPAALDRPLESGHAQDAHRLRRRRLAHTRADRRQAQRAGGRTDVRDPVGPDQETAGAEISADVLRVFERLVVGAFNRRRMVATVAALTALLAGVALTRVRFDSNVLHLLPQRSPAVQAFQMFLDAFGNLDRLYVMFVAPPDRVIADDQAAIDEYVGQLRAMPEIDAVDAGRDDPGKDWSYLADRQLLLLGPSHVGDALARLDPARYAVELAEARAQLALPSSDMKTLVRQDPLRLLPLLRNRLADGGMPLPFDPTQTGYVSDDHRNQLVTAKPARPPFDTALCERPQREARCPRRQGSRDQRGRGRIGRPPSADRRARGRGISRGCPGRGRHQAREHHEHDLVARHHHRHRDRGVPIGAAAGGGVSPDSARRAGDRGGLRHVAAALDGRRGKRGHAARAGRRRHAVALHHATCSSAAMASSRCGRSRASHRSRRAYRLGS